MAAGNIDVVFKLRTSPTYDVSRATYDAVCTETGVAPSEDGYLEWRRHAQRMTHEPDLELSMNLLSRAIVKAALSGEDVAKACASMVGALTMTSGGMRSIAERVAQAEVAAVRQRLTTAPTDAR